MIPVNADPLPSAPGVLKVTDGGVMPMHWRSKKDNAKARAAARSKVPYWLRQPKTPRERALASFRSARSAGRQEKFKPPKPFRAMTYKQRDAYLAAWVKRCDSSVHPPLTAEDRGI